jgi:hypothetical protein
MSTGGAEAQTLSDALLQGYLQKKTRDGRWQKRWFETSGVYLTYYKSKKMEKLLAALSLPQVAGIRVVDMDAAENPERLDGLFALELSSRVYILRAKSNEEAALWVKTLLKLRYQGAAHGSSNPMGGHAAAMINAAATGTNFFDDKEHDKSADNNKSTGMSSNSIGRGASSGPTGPGGQRAPSGPLAGTGAAGSEGHVAEWVKSVRNCMTCC